MTVSTNSNVVLVVEDDEATRSALSELVELDRFVVARASNGAEALEYLRTSSQPPRLIVLDLTLPKLDGYQFLAEQKGLRLLPNTDDSYDWPVTSGSEQDRCRGNLLQARRCPFVSRCHKPLPLNVSLNAAPLA